jgi:protein TonB
MTPATAKLASPPIAPAVAPHAASAGASTLPSVAIMSVALHSLAALALTQLPLPTSIARDLEMTWVSFDLETPATAPVAAVEEETPTPPEPLPPPPEVVHRERPRPIETPEPEVAPEPEVQAPPSIDDVFAEPPPPAAMMTSDATTGSAFAMAPGELGGVPGGRPGGHGTSLVSAHAPAPQAGPSDADRRRARRSYVHAVEELVRAHTRYPRAASREGLQGRVELALRIGDDGRLLAVRVATTSGHSLLDDAAIAAAREIDRMPAPPLVAALGATDEVRVGVVYLVR